MVGLSERTPSRTRRTGEGDLGSGARSTRVAGVASRRLQSFTASARGAVSSGRSGVAVRSGVVGRTRMTRGLASPRSLLGGSTRRGASGLARTTPRSEGVSGARAVGGLTPSGTRARTAAPRSLPVSGRRGVAPILGAESPRSSRTGIATRFRSLEMSFFLATQSVRSGRSPPARVRFASSSTRTAVRGCRRASRPSTLVSLVMMPRSR